ncbi:MAG: ATP-binding protein [Erysipelotrichaceae bacterium]|nr:ATP-binding protein [Erysipelotrichaceae bacterium]
MLNERLKTILDSLDSWEFPAPVEDMPHGDMPGDKVLISDALIPHAQTLFRLLVKEMYETDDEKYVIAIFGGSGSGKSVTTALLTYYFNEAGIRTYALSGDNYPRRIPEYNDAERISIFRSEGLKGLVKENLYSKDVQNILSDLWKKETDSDPKEAEAYPWLAVYQKYGREGLRGYLGEDKEQDYEQINEILRSFKQGDEKIWLKRMGRTEDARWYDEVDFSDTDVLLLEWTHSGAEQVENVDISICLRSTPEETKAYRLFRARDGKADSAFVTMVLEIEQEKLDRRMESADIILAKDGKVLRP